MDFEGKIEERELNPEHVFIASLIAGFNELGLSNQAIVNRASKRVGKYLAMLAEVKNPPRIDKNEDLELQHRKIIETLNSTSPISSDVKLEKMDDNFVVKIRSSKCKFCPKGVGEAELTEGTICPFPGIVEEFVNYFSEKKVELTRDQYRALQKENDWCIIKYKEI